MKIKKIFPLILGVGSGFLTIARGALAAPTPTAGPIQVNLSNVGSNVGIPTSGNIGTIIGNGIKIVMIIALIAVLAMMIYGALQWIISGGEKEKVASARGRITHSLIGLTILGLAFIIITFIGNIIGITNLFDLQIPTLTTPITTP